MLAVSFVCFVFSVVAKTGFNHKDHIEHIDFRIGKKRLRMAISLCFLCSLWLQEKVNHKDHKGHKDCRRLFSVVCLNVLLRGGRVSGRLPE